jgi:hypothetical protein
MSFDRLGIQYSLHHQEENAALLEQFLENLEAANRSPHTIAAYRFGIADFLNFTLGLHVANVTYRQVSEWLHFLSLSGPDAPDDLTKALGTSVFLPLCKIDWGDEHFASRTHSTSTNSSSNSSMAKC